jgi:homoserine dehydrogenase
MKDGKASFDESLKEAMAMGYAERDPSADIKGWDSRRKICILAHVAFGAPLDDSNIPCEGIENLTKEDMVYAKKLGCTVKLLAVAEKVEGGYYAYVGPAMVPVSQMIAYVEGVFNAISVHGDMVGMSCSTAGRRLLPTASAISADIIDCVWHASGIKAADSYSESVQPLDAGRAKTKLFIRVSGEWGGKEERYIKERLPGVEIIRLYEKPDEFAFITSQDAYCTLYDMVKSLKEKVPVLQSLRYLG